MLNTRIPFWLTLSWFTATIILGHYWGDALRAFAICLLLMCVYPPQKPFFPFRFQSKLNIIVPAILFAGVFTGMGLSWHISSRQGGVDFAYFLQAAHNTFHPQYFLAKSLEGENSLLNHHFSPIIALLFPLTLLPNPWIAVGFLKALLWSASCFLCLTSLKRRVESLFACLLTALFFCSPYVWGTISFEFHELDFLPLFGILTFVFYLERRFIPFIFTLLGLCLIKETVLISLCFLGGVLLIFNRKNKEVRKFDFCILIFPAIFLFSYFKIILPFYGRSSFKYNFHYDYLGNSILDIVIQFFSRPIWFLKTALNLEKMIYLLKIAGCFFIVLLVLKKPWAIFAATPALAMTTLSANASHRSDYFHHGVEATFVLFVTCLYIVAHQKNLKPFQKSRSLVIALAIQIWMFATVENPTARAKSAFLKADYISKDLRAALHSVSKEARILTQSPGVLVYLYDFPKFHMLDMDEWFDADIMILENQSLCQWLPKENYHLIQKAGIYTIIGKNSVNLDKNSAVSVRDFCLPLPNENEALVKFNVLNSPTECRTFIIELHSTDMFLRAIKRIAVSTPSDLQNISILKSEFLGELNSDKKNFFLKAKCYRSNNIEYNDATSQIQSDIHNLEYFKNQITNLTY